MSGFIAVENDGQLITASSYWGSEYDRAGKLYVSCNAGAIRILVPASQGALIEECRRSEYAILSRGPWPELGLAEAVEILFEDRSDSPVTLHLSPESFDFLPAEPEAGKEWVLALWTQKKGRPHKALERKCHWRRVSRLPWLKPWQPG
jgi:hypothetical protein